MIDKDLRALGRRIQMVRRGQRITQECLAERVGISTNYLSNIETGRDTCSFIVCLEIANALNTSMDYLLGGRLRYNLNRPEFQTEVQAQLFYQINGMSEADCEHLLRYLDLMREYRQPK